MKQIYTMLLLTLVTLSAQSRTVNTVTTWWGDWSTKGNWSLNRLPQSGDSVVIPAGYAIVVDKNISFTNLYINVMGNLTLQKTLTLDNASTVLVPTGGQINAWGADRTKEIIVLGGVDKFNQTNSSRFDGFGIANSISSTAPNGFSLTSLPVTFSSFYAVKNNNNVMLTWSTAQEFNNNNFEIQRSTDGSNWNVIAVIMGAGTSTSTMQYSYTDKNVNAAVMYYRIRQVDFDNKSAYSIVKTIRGSEAAPVTKVYAASNAVNIEFNKAVAGNITVRIINANGQLMAQQNFGQSAYRITMNTNGKGAGLYVIQVSDNQGWSESTKLIL